MPRSRRQVERFRSGLRHLRLVGDPEPGHRSGQRAGELQQPQVRGHAKPSTAQSTVKVTGKVSADAVNKIAPPIKATGPVPGTVWIEKDGDHQLVQAKLEKTRATRVQMTLSNWDQPVTGHQATG